jgi:hypothetical protein
VSVARRHASQRKHPTQKRSLVAANLSPESVRERIGIDWPLVGPRHFTPCVLSHKHVEAVPGWRKPFRPRFAPDPSSFAFRADALRPESGHLKWVIDAPRKGVDNLAGGNAPGKPRPSHRDPERVDPFGPSRAEGFAPDLHHGFYPAGWDYSCSPPSRDTQRSNLFDSRQSNHSFTLITKDILK